MMAAAHPDSWGAFLMQDMQGHARQRRQKHIVIGICTRQRNTLLCRLIDSIMTQDAPIAFSVELLIVDNNDRPTAADAIDGMPGPFPITVVHEAQAGLVFARNRALDEASARQADWFIRLDDDEWVAPDWLSNLIIGMSTHGRPILIAPCRYIYDDHLSPFRRPFQIAKQTAGAAPAILATSNFAIERCIFCPETGSGLRFDPAFNESGGEDVEFFLRARRAFNWAPASWPSAVAYENWNGERATLGYHLKRTLR